MTPLYHLNRSPHPYDLTLNLYDQAHWSHCYPYKVVTTSGVFTLTPPVSSLHFYPAHSISHSHNHTQKRSCFNFIKSHYNLYLILIHISFYNYCSIFITNHNKLFLHSFVKSSSLYFYLLNHNSPFHDCYLTIISRSIAHIMSQGACQFLINFIRFSFLSIRTILLLKILK